VVKQKILVVEDAVDIARLLQIYFVSQGYEVFVAMCGKDALKICRNSPLT
jgi:DNA-binding response OmpR family regulator